MVLLLIGVPLYSKDFDTVQERATKEEIIQKLGKPSKILKRDADSSYEYWIWYESDNTWIMLLENDKSTGSASTVEDMLNTFLEIPFLFDDGETSELMVENIEEEKEEPLDLIMKDIEVSVLKAKIIDTIFDDREAGFRLKIKNNSSETIYKLRATIYFYDNNGRIFYEETRTLVDSESWTDPIILEPNYSIIYPEADESTFSTVSKMDIDEWDEGVISIEILEVKTTPLK
jgi:hypothetical protein